MYEAVADNPFLSRESKRTVKKIIKKRIKKSDKKQMVTEFYNKLEEAIFTELSNRENYQYSAYNEIVLRIFEGLTIKAKLYPEREEKFNFSTETVNCGERIQLKPHITETYKDKVNIAL